MGIEWVKAREAGKHSAFCNAQDNTPKQVSIQNVNGIINKKS